MRRNQEFLKTASRIWFRTMCDKRKLSQRMPSYLNTSEKNPSSVNLTRTKSATTAEEAVNNILYNFGSNIREVEEQHILSVFADNEAGVLSKVSGLLSSRGFNIDSITCSRTNVKTLSRMTIVLKGNHTKMEQAKRQLEDLCDIWAVFDYTSPESLMLRELCLVKLSCIPSSFAEDWDRTSYEHNMAIHFHKQAISEICGGVGATLEDIGSDTVVVQLVSWPRRVEAFLKLLKPFTIIEAVRSGMIAMNRSRVHDAEDDKEKEEETTIDISELPPS